MTLKVGDKGEGNTIVAQLAALGIDEKRLAKVLAPKADNWGGLVHAFEVLTVLGVVHKAMQEDA